MNSAKFNIVVDPAASRDLKRLHHSNRDVCQHIVSCITSLATEPYQGKPLKGDKKGCVSLRYGDYRIIYEVYPRERTVHIIRIGHRRDVYC